MINATPTPQTEPTESAPIDAATPNAEAAAVRRSHAAEPRRMAQGSAPSAHTGGISPNTGGISPNTGGISPNTGGISPNTGGIGVGVHGIGPGSKYNRKYNQAMQSTGPISFEPANEARDRYRDGQWAEMLSRVGGAHGTAVVTLAQLICTKAYADDMLAGATLAVELLTGWADAELEQLTVLVNDGWKLSLGELLRCAQML